MKYPCEIASARMAHIDSESSLHGVYMRIKQKQCNNCVHQQQGGAPPEADGQQRGSCYSKAPSKARSMRLTSHAHSCGELIQKNHSNKTATAATKAHSQKAGCRANHWRNACLQRCCAEGWGWKLIGGGYEEPITRPSKPQSLRWRRGAKPQAVGMYDKAKQRRIEGRVRGRRSPKQAAIMPASSSAVPLQ